MEKAKPFVYEHLTPSFSFWTRDPLKTSPVDTKVTRGPGKTQMRFPGRCPFWMDPPGPRSGSTRAPVHFAALNLQSPIARKGCPSARTNSW